MKSPLGNSQNPPLKDAVRELFNKLSNKSTE